MSTYQLAARILRNNLIQLTFLCAGVVFGAIFTLLDGWSWRWLACAVVWQGAILWWANDQFRLHRKDVSPLRAIAGIELYALVQIILVELVLVGTPLVLDIIGQQLDGKYDAWFLRYLSGADVAYLAAIVVQFNIVLAIALAWARLHQLASDRVDLATLVTGEFYQRRMSYPMDATTAEKVLQRLLERLRAPATPRLVRHFAAASATLSREAGSFVVRWAYRPCEAVISIHAADGARCDVQVRFRRRKWFLLEPILNIIDVHVHWIYLNMHVLQPLASEMNLSQAVRKQDELRHLALESQLRILQAQIEPHFLFNTLANVRHLYRSSHDAGEQMMDHLITYLRGTLDELRSDASTLGKEMDLALHYLAIMKIRMGERLSYSFILPPGLSEHGFPPAMLISLVENAVKHGLHDRPDGKLLVEARQDGAMLQVTVQDNGPGLSSIGGTGVGLSNIRQRLEAIYGTRAWLEVGALHSGGFMARIAIPFTSGEPV